ncbi:C15 family peptidase [Saccharopolyspora rosea]|uniref:Uncharacterized protein n=1 Tax=Saccharopolyspora rosea TaxID=524884 RepID=A0ABW3FPS9_9PSEU|nr:hypothetical protein [Saccharopolyspora rosea]
MKQVLIAAALAVVAVAATVAPASATPRGCLDPAVPLPVEENRLGATLPDEADPGRAQAEPLSERMIGGAGFGAFTPDLVARLCRTSGPAAARAVVVDAGERLWRAAVDRAQRRVVRGALPSSDDRPLYWTRLRARAALRQWVPGFRVSRERLVTAFDRASRGVRDVDFPPGVRRVLVSGFDPYTLDGGQRGPAPGTVGNNLRHGNPSGAAALALDGTTVRTPDGGLARIEAYTLPVNYPEFARGYLEDTVGPAMRRGLDASVTISQAGGAAFDLEQWNGRYHGVSPGNDGVRPCPPVHGAPRLAVDDPRCDTAVVPRWGGPADFDLHNPPQWTSTTLPVDRMIAARTGAGVPRPPGDTWPDQSEAFGVVWHTNYTEFPDCRSTERVTRNSPVPPEHPPAAPPVPPDPGSCSYSGGGGNYLSNESGYRNALLRDRMGLDIPAGHVHTPDMQHFETRFGDSDATFDAWRRAIVHQTRELIRVVADG